MPNKTSNDIDTQEKSTSLATSQKKSRAAPPTVVSASPMSDETAGKPDSRLTSPFTNSSLLLPIKRETKPRDIEVITTEIHHYNLQFGEAAYDVGKLLLEAKGQLEHGQWLEWLRNRVDFSEATARRFIRIAKEYPNRSTVTDLGFSKAIALLELSQEERTVFMGEHYIVNGVEKGVVEMSCRELRKMIKDKASQATVSPEPEDESEENAIPEPETSYYDNNFNPDEYIKNIQERIDGMLDYIRNQVNNFDTRDGLSCNLRTMCEDTLQKLRQAELLETEA